MYSSTDCWGCRATPATFCASCVHKAISERHARLKEIQQDKAKLEEAMAGNMKRREALQRQDQARRRHSATAAALQAELEATRRDTDRLAKEAETLRQTMRHSKSPPHSSSSSRTLVDPQLPPPRSAIPILTSGSQRSAAASCASSTSCAETFGRTRR